MTHVGFNEAPAEDGGKLEELSIGYSFDFKLQ